ncbi:hypothetical protein DMI82_15455 [Blautia sp. BCRC 81119]|uniref:type I-E CRISPR-associated protein Cse1/CasA n=1 Tax=Blautia sp. BCRC 81119 TaxID=2212480 RepID=UPI000D7253CD|nr:type I-E CRISPR-associated protein Cse1/CasA [Blautia sp. BCRC 81119]PWY58447.1 hypothetical protein DMI82_15455 [Blautia sp. BCRC 81119]
MFNVLYEPWMGVIDMDGNETLVGLRDYLVNAHLYKCSAENKQFAVLRRLQQRLAETFVMDIFGINIDAETALINAGHFDADEIDAYIRNCENSGVSFDLFDENRPFMQTDKKTFEKIFKSKKSVSVATINPRMGSGNNKVFFNNVSTKNYIKNTAAEDCRDSYYDSVYNKKYTVENAEVVSFAEYMNLLLIAHCIAGQGGAGYRSGLMCVGVPPILYHIDSDKNQTLFHSILMNIAFDSKHNVKNDAPLWRWATYERGKENLNSCKTDTVNVPKMEGMFFPVMYLYPDLSSIDETNKTISKVYKINIDLGEADLIAAARERWIEETEPSVSIKEIKTASRTFKTGTRFAESNRSWLDIKTYADVYDGGAPKCLAGFKLTSGYDSFDMEDVFGRPIMTAYYLAMEQAKYLVQGEYQCYLPLCILRDQNKKIVSKGFITAAENMAYQLIRDIKTVDKALNSSDPANDNNKHEIQTVERVLGNRFMRYCEGLFKKEFIPEIAKIDEDDDFYTETLKEKLNNYISKMAGYSWQLIYQVPVPYGKSIEAQKIYEKIRTERKKKREQHSNKSN